MTPTRPVRINSSDAGSGVGERLGPPLFGTLPPGPGPPPNDPVVPVGPVVFPAFCGGVVAPSPAIFGIGVVSLPKIGGATTMALDGAVALDGALEDGALEDDAPGNGALGDGDDGGVGVVLPTPGVVTERVLLVVDSVVLVVVECDARPPPKPAPPAAMEPAAEACPPNPDDPPPR